MMKSTARRIRSSGFSASRGSQSLRLDRAAYAGKAFRVFSRPSAGLRSRFQPIGRGRRHSPWNSISVPSAARSPPPCLRLHRSSSSPADRRRPDAGPHRALHGSWPTGWRGSKPRHVRGRRSWAPSSPRTPTRQVTFNRPHRVGLSIIRHGGRDDEARDPGTGWQGSEYHPAHADWKRDLDRHSRRFSPTAPACRSLNVASWRRGLPARDPSIA